MMKHVTAGELLDELDLGGDVAELAAQSGVDVQVKKLDGVTLLKLLVYGMLSADDLSLRVLSNIAEVDLENAALLRVLAYRLLQTGKTDLACDIFEQVLTLRPEEFVRVQQRPRHPVRLV